MQLDMQLLVLGKWGDTPTVRSLVIASSQATRDPDLINTLHTVYWENHLSISRIVTQANSTGQQTRDISQYTVCNICGLGYQTRKSWGQGYRKW